MTQEKDYSDPSAVQTSATPTQEQPASPKLGGLTVIRNSLVHARRAHERWMKRYDGEAGTFEDERFAWLLTAVEKLADELERGGNERG
jgi:hypothetical protein